MWRPYDLLPSMNDSSVSKAKNEKLKNPDGPSKVFRQTRSL